MRASDVDEARRLHRPDVAYMGPELGPFRCGHCVFYDSGPSVCAHPEIRAPVAFGGCCNYYRTLAG